MAKEKQEIQWCVKVSTWKNGFLQKMISKDLFSKEADAVRFYNECEVKGTRVQLSKYIDGNEREIMNKQN